MIRLLTVASLLFFGCSDSLPGSDEPDNRVGTILLQDASIDARVDAFYIDFTFPDAYVDPCLSITSSDEQFCDCEPQCCQVQQWYCPPSGLGVNALIVTGKQYKMRLLVHQ